MVELPDFDRLVSIAVHEAERAAHLAAGRLWEWFGLTSVPPGWTEDERSAARVVVASACAPLQGRGPCGCVRGCCAWPRTAGRRLLAGELRGGRRGALASRARGALRVGASALRAAHEAAQRQARAAVLERRASGRGPAQAACRAGWPKAASSTGCPARSRPRSCTPGLRRGWRSASARTPSSQPGTTSPRHVQIDRRAPRRDRAAVRIGARRSSRRHAMSSLAGCAATGTGTPRPRSSSCASRTSPRGRSTRSAIAIRASSRS